LTRADVYPVAAMMADYHSGMTYAEIGRKYGLSLDAAYRALKEAGLKSRRRGPRLGLQPTPQLTPDRSAQREAIYLAYQSGKTMGELAIKQGVSSERVRQVVALYEKAKGLEKRRHRGAQPREVRNCAECGEPFEARVPSQKCCSPRCGMRFARSHRAVKMPLEVMIADYNSGMGFRAVARKYAFDTMTVRRRLLGAGLKSRPGGRRGGP
jgi:Mor family transcriptional regulator